MTPPAHGAAATARAHPHARRAGAPGTAIPRRVSGPAAPHRRPAVAPPRPPRRAARPTTHRGQSTPLQRLLALPDHPLVCALVSGRAWIWLLGLGLGGIVFMQVSLLKLNAGIGRAVEASATLERKNAALEARVASLGRHERIAEFATKMQMQVAPAGSTRFLTARPGTDVARAVATMRPVGDFDAEVVAAAQAAAQAAAAAQALEAQEAQAAALAEQTATATATSPAAPAPAATATPAPAATATPAATPTPVPEATPEPVATAQPTATAAPAQSQPTP